MDLVINVVLAVGTVVVWLAMARGRGSDRSLALGGLRSLKYYTVLSNLFCGVTSALYACGLVLAGGVGPALLALKLAATATVCITFLVTALLLGPTMGWRPMYSGPNFWLHLVFPLLAVADVVAFAPMSAMPFWLTLLSAVPTAAYAVWYLGRIRANGVERDGEVYDFYGFARWGEDKLPAVAAGITLLTWAIAAGLWLVG